MTRFFCLLLQSALVLVGTVPAVACAAEPIPCIAQGANLRDMTVVHPTAAQRRRIAAGYRLPSVVGFKHALQAAIHGAADPETTAAIAPIQRARLSDSFTLLANEGNLMGGETLTIMFNHHLDAVYWVWMYHLSGGSWVIRAFRAEQCSKQQLHWIVNRYAEFIR